MVRPETGANLTPATFQLESHRGSRMKWFWRGEDLHSDPPRFRILTAGFGCVAIDDLTGEQSGLLADLEAAREWCLERGEEP